MAQRVRCTKIRPAVVVAWVEWLRLVYGARLADLGIRIDEAVLAYYRSMRDISVPVSVPVSWAANLHVVDSQADADRAVAWLPGSGLGMLTPDQMWQVSEATDVSVMPMGRARL